MNTGVIMVSGGFDPVHIGHIDMFVRASVFGEVIVALNSDEWLRRKKGREFMQWGNRAAILKQFRCIAGVVKVKDHDGTVCEALERIRPQYFGNGGDRKEDNTPELETCKRLGIQPIFGLGAKVESSSELLARAAQPVKRPWGEYTVLHTGHGFKVKLLTVQPGQQTSYQRHAHRREVWVRAFDPAQPDGMVRLTDFNEWHQLTNPTDKPMHVVEVQTGTYFGEDDIERK